MPEVEHEIRIRMSGNSVVSVGCACMAGRGRKGGSFADFPVGTPVAELVAAHRLHAQAPALSAVGPKKRPVDRNAVVADYRRWLHRVAYEMVGFGQDGICPEDLAQEGYIAMWRAIPAYDPKLGSLPSWLTRAAELRMRDVVQRGVEFGQTYKRNPGTQEGLRGQRSLEELPSVELDHLEQRIAVWLSDGLALAYHRGAIQRAIGRLTPDEQRYVVMRFWHGKSDAEIQPHVQGNVIHLWRGPRGARVKLREQLGKLA